jgi:hypothetical protein
MTNILVARIPNDTKINDGILSYMNDIQNELRLIITSAQGIKIKSEFACSKSNKGFELLSLKTGNQC